MASSPINRFDPNHHLWRNGRLWWIAFTVHRGHLQERIRFSLKTNDLAEARHRRDEALATYAGATDFTLSIRPPLDFEPKRRGSLRQNRRGANRPIG